MKKVKTISLVSLLTAGLLAMVSSCSLLNSPEIPTPTDDPTPAANEVEGSYTGEMGVAVMGVNVPYDVLTFVITAENDSLATITTPPFSYTSMILPSLDITGVKVTGKDGSYAIADTEYGGTSTDGKEYYGTFKGSVIDDVLTLSMSLQYGSMPMAMVISFSGSKD